MVGLCLKSHIQLESEVFWFVLVHVTSWIVLVFLDKRTIHEVTRTKHETRYHRNGLLRQGFVVAEMINNFFVLVASAGATARFGTGSC